VESIAEDLLGLEVERTELDVSGVLLPTERRILVNAHYDGWRRRKRQPTTTFRACGRQGPHSAKSFPKRQLASFQGTWRRPPIKRLN